MRETDDDNPIPKPTQRTVGGRRLGSAYNLADVGTCEEEERRPLVWTGGGLLQRNHVMMPRRPRRVHDVWPPQPRIGERQALTTGRSR